MKNSKAQAKWQGNLKNGTGSIKFDSLDKSLAYNFNSRFETGNQTTPEELIAAAHAGCYSMALSGLLTDEGFEPESIETSATVTIEKADNGFKISKSALKTNAVVRGIDEEVFKDLAEKAKVNCPVSKALSAIEITLETNLNT